MTERAHPEPAQIEQHGIREPRLLSFTTSSGLSSPTSKARPSGTGFRKPSQRPPSVRTVRPSEIQPAWLLRSQLRRSGARSARSAAPHQVLDERPRSPEIPSALRGPRAAPSRRRSADPVHASPWKCARGTRKYARSPTRGGALEDRTRRRLACRARGSLKCRFRPRGLPPRSTSNTRSRLFSSSAIGAAPTPSSTAARGVTSLLNVTTRAPFSGVAVAPLARTSRPRARLRGTSHQSLRTGRNARMSS